MLQRLGKVTEQLLLSNFLSRCWKLKISPSVNNTVLVTHDCFAGVKPTWLLLTQNEMSLADGYLGNKSLHNLQYRSVLSVTGALTQSKRNFKLWAFAKHATGIPAASGKYGECGDSALQKWLPKIPAWKQTASKQRADFMTCRYSSGTNRHSSAGSRSFVLVIWGFTSGNPLLRASEENKDQKEKGFLQRGRQSWRHWARSRQQIALALQDQAGRFAGQLLHRDSHLSANWAAREVTSSVAVIMMGTEETQFPSALDAKYFPSSIFGYVSVTEQKIRPSRFNNKRNWKHF